VVPFPALPDSPGAAPAYPSPGAAYPAVIEGVPGIYPGTVGAFPALGLSLQAEIISPFAVLASSIANDINYDAGNGIGPDGGVEESCEQLIGTHGLGPNEVAPSVKGRLTPGTDYFPLPTIPAGTLNDTKTYLLTVNGCLPGATAGAGLGVPETVTCGAGYDGGNTANIGIVQLDTTTVIDGGMGVQFAHRSTAVENTPISVQAGGTTVPIHDPASAGVWPAFFQVVPDAGDDGSAGVVPTNLAATPITYSGTGLTATQTVSVNISTLGAQYPAFGVFVQPLDGSAPNADQWPGTPGAPGDVIALPLSAIQQLSSWNATTKGAPTTFTNGTSWVFIFEGDPVAAQLPNPDGGAGINPAWDGRGVHIVAFPNTFTAVPE
jgi:hypothetical protein